MGQFIVLQVINNCFILKFIHKVLTYFNLLFKTQGVISYSLRYFRYKYIYFKYKYMKKSYYFENNTEYDCFLCNKFQFTEEWPMTIYNICS